jgi:succinoglycan biosynthesis transport protein ExoP
MERGENVSLLNSSREIVLRPAPLAQMSPRMLAAPPIEKELTISDLWSVCTRQRAVILGTVALCLLAAIAYCATATRLYKAISQVQVQKESADGLGLDNANAQGAAGDALDANITLQTQAQVLQSDSLALQVIKQLNLEENKDFKPKWSPIGWALGLVAPAGVKDPSNASLDDSPGRRTHLVKTFESRLQVKPISGTRLIEVSYLNPDPKVAAQVVNSLVQGLIEYNFETRHNATQEVSGWLSAQLGDLRKQSEDLQAKVVSLQHDSGVFTLGQVDNQGHEQTYTPVLDRLQQSTSQVAQAQSARIMKGAVYEAVKSGDAELISGLSGSAMAAASPGVANSMNLIQTLRGQEAAAQAQVETMSAKFGPGYPKLAEAQATLAGIQKSIKDESTRIATRAKNDYKIAESVENNARAEFNEEKQQANALNSKAIEYEMARQEAQQSRTLYQSLLGKVKEADVLAGLRSSNITLVDPARPASRPAKPNVLLFLAASLCGGLFLGVCGALVRDSTDTKIQDLPALEAYFGEAPYAVLPRDREQGLMKEPSTPGIVATTAYTEAVRSLRTSIMRESVTRPPQVILVTSSVPGEGKSKLSSNLAVLLAQQNKRVLLVDGDLRTPTLHTRFNLPTSAGLTSVLGSEEDMIGSARLPAASVMRGLDVMTAGPMSRYPSELLASERMTRLVEQWRHDYDFVVVDGAPVLPVTDSVILSTHADLALVVARHRMTEKQSLERTYSILQSQGTRKIALVLNCVEPSSRTYFDYYGYNHCKYYGAASA